MSPIAITAATAQTQRVILADGSAFTLTIAFKPMQFGWFIKELTYGSFSLKGVRLMTSPNMLHQYKNIIPFGLACYMKGNLDPQLLEDFSSGNAVLSTLDAAEVARVAEFISGQVQ